MPEPGSAAIGDRDYYDKWYRNLSVRVRSDGDLARTVALVVAAAELILARKIRSVLDIGSGEGLWRIHLKRLRPSVRYNGIDPSDYAVRRYGKSRGIRKGTLAEPGSIYSGRVYDIVICSELLNYLPAAELRQGLTFIAEHIVGLAYLELYTVRDDVVGDSKNLKLSSSAYYKQLLSNAGLVAIGLHCYVPLQKATTLAELECPGKMPTFRKTGP